MFAFAHCWYKNKSAKCHWELTPLKRDKSFLCFYQSYQRGWNVSGCQMCHTWWRPTHTILPLHPSITWSGTKSTWGLMETTCTGGMWGDPGTWACTGVFTRVWTWASSADRPYSPFQAFKVSVFPIYPYKLMIGWYHYRSIIPLKAD